MKSNTPPSTQMVSHKRKFSTLLLACGLVLSLGLNNSSLAQELTESVNELVTNLENACPEIWEDMGERIVDPESTVWNTTGDTDTEYGDDSSGYFTYLDEVLGSTLLTDTEKQDALTDIDTIISNCTMARTELLTKYYSNLPQDVVAAMSDLDYEPGDNVDGFEIGDIRYTSRATPLEGWLFLTGQSIGIQGSGADLEGDDYENLYNVTLSQDVVRLQNLANPTQQEETQLETLLASWVNGVVITLPDMQGRTVIGRVIDSNTPAISDEEAKIVGAELGSETLTLSTSQMPVHGHSSKTSWDGQHKHTVHAEGEHDHRLYSSPFNGSDNGGYYGSFEGRGRVPLERYNEISSGSVKDAGEHQHDMDNAPTHRHTISQAGGSQPITTLQPSIVFNVEMKYL